jgi:hypothetical protein
MRAVRSAMLAAAVILATVMSGVVILPTVSAAQSLKDAVKFHEDADELSKQGRYADAERLFRRSLAIREKVFSPDHPDLKQSRDNLAELYRRQGRAKSQRRMVPQ